ncbi:hypothetical protein SK854_05370 [Lentzea sp. BCCO 10_0061]|uniref:Uncharacterized protein n=1 Tax=Lentzea sokolovensis TaxID=3095429 RepID=A0ABU4UPW7_9PSEU|nr:hypothetical protein [Lentzea sp. BCCO 10_0061]MDX8141532.1 hypothetical protein [Lentzea sp. BCCO 10_0061]
MDAGREDQPLTVHVQTAEREERITARAVIDASGTWGSPNPLGGDGLPAVGERAAAEKITYRVPDLVAERARYAGKRIAVAGSGHSALTALVVLAELAEQEPGTKVVWLLRRGAVGNAFGGVEADQLPARGALGLRAKTAVEAGHIETATGSAPLRSNVRRTAASRWSRSTVTWSRGVDEIVVLTGFRPDLSWLSEVRLDLDPVLQTHQQNRHTLVVS